VENELITQYVVSLASVINPKIQESPLPPPPPPLNDPPPGAKISITSPEAGLS
jgi:hypothetical protein